MVSSGSKSYRPKLVVLCLLLVLTLSVSQPVSSETPVCKVSGSDLAPKIIYTGEPYTDNLNDIAMLQITFNTSSETSITINSLTLHRAGKSSDSDILAINIYEDVNQNSEFDPQIDLKISSASFVLGKAELLIGKTITPAQPLTVIVTVDIWEEAKSNNTLGVDIPDQSYIEYNNLTSTAFEFTVSSKNATIYLDTDGDTNPDIFDPDDDNDKYTDDIEILAGTDTKDKDSTPLDTDSDYVPDSIDTDDDNDGVPDKYDDFPKDKNRQRDYTVVILYLVIAVLLIFVMIIILRKGNTKISPLDLEDKDDFKVDKKSKVHLDEEILDDEDLLDDL